MNIYKQFRQEIKSIINSESPVKRQFVLIAKENIIKWKKLYEYELISNNYDIDVWESILNDKFKNHPPIMIFKFFKEYNEIKEYLKKKKGIALINIEFIKYFSPKNENYKKINCHFGNGKIIFEIDNKVYSNCLICKIGSKSSVKYIIYEGSKRHNQKLIEEISKNNYDLNIEIKNFSSYGINKIEVFDYDKNQYDNFGIENYNINENIIINNKKKILKNNNSRINLDNQINQEKFKCNIPDCIFEFLIRVYLLTKDIKHKISAKSKESDNYYLINSNYLEKIKMAYRYNEICKELKNKKYMNDIELENDISKLILLIKQKGIINEKQPLDDEKLIPIKEKILDERHLIYFSLVNKKIIDLIKKIKFNYNLKEEPFTQIRYNFYYFPEFFYQNNNFKYIEIGTLNDDGIFEAYYFISLNLYHSMNLNFINGIRNSTSLREFFKKYNVDMNNVKVQELNDILVKGKIINLKLLNLNKNSHSSNTITTIEQKNYGNNVIKLRAGNKKNQIHYPKTEIHKNNNFPLNSNELIEVNEFIDLSYLDNFPIKSFIEIQFTPLIGLQNIGQTCYMNAALQCFSNTKALTNYFLNYDKLEYIKNNTITIFGSDEPSLAVEYLKLVRHLWCDPPKTYYAPYEFKNAVGKIDPLFKNFEANDAKDFVNFMVMRLHDELNGIDNNLVKQNILAPPTMQLNPYDKSQVLQSYLYEFQINFNSFISNCFYGTTQGEFECQNCKMQLYQYGQNMPLVKYNYQTFFFLNFPLDEVRKYILSNQMLYMKYMNTNTNPNVEVNLIDCFYYYQKDDILSCYCDRCQNINAQVLTRTKLYVAPIYLILLFNRGKGIQFKIKIAFPEILDTNGIFVNPSGIYQLYGVVKHYGDSSASGHFTAYCRSPIDRMWYHYNDAMVTPVNEQEKYIIQENGMTYMLFYSKMNNK